MNAGCPRNGILSPNLHTEGTSNTMSKEIVSFSNNGKRSLQFVIRCGKRESDPYTEQSRECVRPRTGNLTAVAYHLCIICQLEGRFPL